MKRYLFCLTTHIAGIVLLTACALLAFLHEMWFCSITAVLLTVGTSFSLYRIQMRQTSMIQRIVECMKRNDFSQTASPSFSDRAMQELANDLSEVLKGIRNRMLDEEVKLQYYENLLDKVDTAVIVTDHQGRAEWMNKAARPLLGEHKQLPGQVLEALRKRYPDLLIEGCSGGGGRFDAGMMYYTPQIWCSDNTDALDRLQIQYGTSFGYPVSAVGSHVSAVPNHQTGRITSLHTRGVVAMAGTFGYELNLGKLSEEEKQEIRLQVEEYRKFAPLIQTGLYYRLSDPAREEYAAWAFVSEDQKEVLLNVVLQEIHGNMTVNYVKLQGLKCSAIYRDTETGKSYNGAALMEAGIPMPVEMGEFKAYQMHLTAEE